MDPQRSSTNESAAPIFALAAGSGSPPGRDTVGRNAGFRMGSTFAGYNLTNE